MREEEEERDSRSHVQPASVLIPHFEVDPKAYIVRHHGTRPTHFKVFRDVFGDGVESDLLFLFFLNVVPNQSLSRIAVAVVGR